MIESPCVACCHLNKEKICVGCYRHISEIVDWNKRTDKQNTDILHLVEQRKIRAQALGIVDTDTSPITQAEWVAAKNSSKQ